MDLFRQNLFSWKWSWRRTLSVVLLGSCCPLRAVDAEMELISTNSHCQCIVQPFFSHWWAYSLKINSKVVALPFYTQSFLCFHRRRSLFLCLSSHFLRWSRSLLAADQSHGEALFGVNVLVVAMRTLLPVKTPDAGYQTVWVTDDFCV